MLLKLVFPLVVVTALVGVGTYYQGLYTERWVPQNSELLQLLSTNLESSPDQFGEWISEATPLSDAEFELTGCRAYDSRLFKHKRTGREVSVYVVSGTARHITIHSPDWCYVGAGFKMEGKPSPYSIPLEDGTDAEFLTTTFMKTDATGQQRLRIFWAYSDDGKWIGPDVAKTYFAGRPALVKVYLISPAPEGEVPEESPVLDFAKEFVPLLNSRVFAKAPAPNVDPTDLELGTL